MEVESEKKDNNAKAEEIKEVPMEDCDLRELGNPQHVSEYAATIFKYLRENEVRVG